MVLLAAPMAPQPLPCSSRDQTSTASLRSLSEPTDHPCLRLVCVVYAMGRMGRMERPSRCKVPTQPLTENLHSTVFLGIKQPGH